MYVGDLRTLVTTSLFLTTCTHIWRAVDGRIEIIDVVLNTTVFSVEERPLIPKTSTDVVGFLVISDPPDACSPVEPPSNDTVYQDYEFLELFNTNSTVQWVLIATWKGVHDCSLVMKAKHAQEGGYSAIIIQSLVSNDSSHAIPLWDWDDIDIYPCIVGKSEGRYLKEKFTNESYLAKFDESTIDTWFGYVIAGTLVILAVILAIGLSYVVVQMLMLILLWIRASIIHAIQTRRRNLRRRLPASQLKKLPIRSWSDDSTQDTCSICLENFLVSEKVRILPCSHIFHTECIDPWLLKQRRKCPNCKRKIIFADERRPPPDSDSSTDDETTPLLRSSSEINGNLNDSPDCERNETVENATARAADQGGTNNTREDESITRSSEASGHETNRITSEADSSQMSTSSSSNTVSHPPASGIIREKVEQLCARMEQVGNKIKRKMKIKSGNNSNNSVEGRNAGTSSSDDGNGLVSKSTSCSPDSLSTTEEGAKNEEEVNFECSTTNAGPATSQSQMHQYEELKQRNNALIHPVTTGNNISDASNGNFVSTEVVLENANAV